MLYKKIHHGNRVTLLETQNLRVLYFEQNYVNMVIKTKRMQGSGSDASTVKMRNAYTDLVGKREVNDPIRRHWRRWKIMFEYILRK
jgi:hypothetical protein